MADILMIGSVLNSIKAATDIAKLLRESDVSLERAELKLKLADLVSSLADAKIQLVEIQESLANKDKRIAELEEAFQAKDMLKRHHDAYYIVDEVGNPTGIPFCLRCWENDHKKRQLVQDAKENRKRICTSCGHRYNDWMVKDIQPQAEQQKT